MMRESSPASSTADKPSAERRASTTKRATSPASTVDKPVKRRRVSLACDQCRAVRGRCDGARPSCMACKSHSRSCTYPVSTKRRGTPGGYQRVLETSLGYLLNRVPQSEELLTQLLQSDALAGGSRVGKSLQDTWTGSRIRRSIFSQLADGFDPSALTPATSDQFEGLNRTASESSPSVHLDLHSKNPSASAIPSLARITPPGGQTANAYANVTLPANWRQLLDIHFQSTHCWLPIVEKDAIFELAASIPPEGIPSNANEDFPPEYAELWAVLALASFQHEAACDGSSAARARSSKRLYSVARNMMPSEEKQFEIHHLRALLFHSLVLTGQGAGLAAWMLVGTALRLGLHLRETPEFIASDSQHKGGSNMPPGLRAFAASLTLNAFCSASLGQQTFLRVDTSEIDDVVNDEAADLDPSPDARALRTFKQLYKFAQVLSTASESRQSTKAKPAPEDLTRLLSPEFAFCNSIFVVPTAKAPRGSGFFLHMVYLATLSQLVTDYRSSILSSLQDVLERCLLQLGAHEAPPIVVGLVGMVLRSRCAIDIEPAQSSRWMQLLEALKTVWTQKPYSYANGIQDQAAAARVLSGGGGGGGSNNTMGSPLSMSDGGNQGLDNLLWGYFAASSPRQAPLLDSSFSAQLGGADLHMDALGSPELLGLDGGGFDDDFL